MSASSDFKELLRSFNEYQVRYLVLGAYAVMKYTEPRYTKDLDIWVEATDENASRVLQCAYRIWRSHERSRGSRLHKGRFGFSDRHSAT